VLSRVGAVARATLPEGVSGQFEGAAKAFESAGVDELIFDPTVPALEEVDRLADAVL